MQGGGGQSGIFNFAKSKARIVSSENPVITFDNVAGCDEAKFELQEIAPTALNTGAMIRKGKSGKSKEDGMTDKISADLLNRFQEELSSPKWECKSEWESDRALQWFYYGCTCFK